MRSFAPALLLATLVGSANPSLAGPDDGEVARRGWRPRPLALGIGAVVLGGAGTSFALSQRELRSIDRQAADLRTNPVSLPYSASDRARLDRYDESLARQRNYQRAATALTMLGGGFVIVGVIGKRGRGPISDGSADAVAVDLDGDGIIEGDLCPNEPETFNRWKDDDGCPDELGTLLFSARHQGELREGLQFALSGGGESRTFLSKPEPALLVDLIPGAYDVRSLEPFWEGDVQFKVNEGANEISVELTEIIPGTLVVTARDETGEAIRDATATVAPQGGGEGRQVELDASGYGEALVAPGSWSIFVEAPGYGIRRTDAEVVAEEKTEIETTLKPAKADLTGERIELLEKVFFTAGSNAVDPQSYELLEEIANLVLRRSSILLLEVQGHTSSEGGFDLNQRLSEARAAAVEAYLIQQGVPRPRVQSVGYGPTKPLVTERTEADRAKNRRVEFVILQRKEE